MAQNVRNDSLTVGTSVVQVSQNMTGGTNHRVGINLRNSSTGGQTISLAFSDNQQAVANSGIVLAAGQNIADFDSEGYIAWQGNITAIASAAGATLSIYERTGA